MKDTSAISLYTHPMSPCAQKVRLVLSEKAIAWNAVYVDLANKENLKPDYLRLNPLGVVPTLVHDGRPIIESSIICEYLDDCFPQPPLRSPDPAHRAEMRLWMKHVDNKLHPACGAMQWTIVMRPAMVARPPAEQVRLLDAIPDDARRERQKRLVAMGFDAPDVSAAIAIYRNTLLKMEIHLTQSRWVSGDQFSLADACLAPYFQTLLQFGWLGLFADGCPAVLDWFCRIRQRPSWTKAVAADFSADELAKLKTAGEEPIKRIKAQLD